MLPSMQQLSIEGLYKYSTISKLFDNGFVDNDVHFLNQIQPLEFDMANEQEMTEANTAEMSEVMDVNTADVPAVKEEDMDTNDNLYASLHYSLAAKSKTKKNANYPLADLKEYFHGNVKTEQQTRDTDTLVLCCIHSALSMVKYSNNTIELKTHKIKLVQSLLKPETASPGINQIKIFVL